MSGAWDPTYKTGTMKRGSKNGTTYAAAFHYVEPEDTPRARTPPSSNANATPTGPTGMSSPRNRIAQVVHMNGYNASPDLSPPLYVRALYNYEADDQTSLSFHQGDVIQVLTQLESGWWDGVINDVRGWFPSNYCQVLSGPDDVGDLANGHDSETTESGTEEEDYGEEQEDSDSHTQDDDSDLPIEGTENNAQEEAAFWIPQATADGRLYYFNTLTGVSTTELPLERPTLANETGPRDRTNFPVPEQTRAPSNLMSVKYDREDDYDGSASEADGEHSMSASQPSLTQGTSFSSISTSLDSSSTEPASRQITQEMYQPNISMQANMTLAPNGTTATSFSVIPNTTHQKSLGPRDFFDDGNNMSVTWASLVDNMRAAIDAYRSAIQNQERAEFVRRAEDISDYLRLLLAAGSGTTDNHSGNPSIISTNKALYPHFREMMSKFSKLVLSSHIAAADWPGPEAYAKCLQEADGVLNGVYGYVEVARHQRGEEIPRLFPGFVSGVRSGGYWQDNNLNSLSTVHEGSFLAPSDSELKTRPSALLDTSLLNRIEEARKGLAANIKRLNDQLQVTDKVINANKQAAIGDRICLSTGAVIENFRPWITLVESIDLSALGTTFRNSSSVDFASQKQKAYDSIGDMVATCQAVTAPLADEWAEVREESLEVRLHNVRNSCKQLDTSIAQVGYSLKMLLPTLGFQSTLTMNKREHRLTDVGESYQTSLLRTELNRPVLADVGQSKSYTMGQGPPQQSPEKLRRPPAGPVPQVNDKARQFFGQIPPPLSNLKAANAETGFSPDEIPYYLQLDHLGEVTYDMKKEPPEIKSGTLMGLVEQLTRHDRVDTSFNTTFLLTYQTFTTAVELFELVVKRFSVQPPSGLNREEYRNWETHKQKIVRFRVVNILKQWIEHYWMEEASAQSHELLERAAAFASNTLTNTQMPAAKPLATVIGQRLKGQDTSSKRLVLTLTNAAPAAILPKNMKKLKFLDIDPTEFARQLTIIESKMYSKIRPDECLGLKWTRKDRTENDQAPNVRAMILHANQLTNWVAEMILFHPEVKKRVIVIKHFVAIADKCRVLNNFSSLFAIISALGTSPIIRLSRTWIQVNIKTNSLLASLRELIATSKNFGLYRETLHAANPPCIPFLGVYLTDLNFIEEGIPSVVKNTELINVTKRTRTAEVIRDIQQYQNVPYTLNPVPDLQEWIVENMRNAGDVHEMYNRSLQIEPREKEEEKIARLLSESGFL